MLGILLLGTASLLGGCAGATARQGEVRRQPGRRLYAVLAAYEPEILANRAAILGNAKPDRVVTIHGVPFEFGHCEGRDVVLFKTGMSMVNAAMTTQLALDHFPITQVLFAGIAGGVNPTRHIGDVVVPDRWANHSEAAYFNPKPGGGYVIDPTFPVRYTNFDWIFPSDTWVVREGAETPTPWAAFDADRDLLSAARRALVARPRLFFAGEPCAASVGGMGISGSVYCDNREYRKWAFSVWKAECLDMESTAVAQVCWASRTPFLIVRALSDLAGGQEGQNPSSQTEGPVAKNAAAVLLTILETLPAAD